MNILNARTFLYWQEEKLAYLQDLAEHESGINVLPAFYVDAYDEFYRETYTTEDQESTDGTTKTNTILRRTEEPFPLLKDIALELQCQNNLQRPDKDSDDIDGDELVMKVSLGGVGKTPIEKVKIPGHLSKNYNPNYKKKALDIETRRQFGQANELFLHTLEGMYLDIVSRGVRKDAIPESMVVQCYQNKYIATDGERALFVIGGQVVTDQAMRRLPTKAYLEKDTLINFAVDPMEDLYDDDGEWIGQQQLILVDADYLPTKQEIAFAQQVYEAVNDIAVVNNGFFDDKEPIAYMQVNIITDNNGELALMSIDGANMDLVPFVEARVEKNIADSEPFPILDALAKYLDKRMTELEQEGKKLVRPSNDQLAAEAVAEIVAVTDDRNFWESGYQDWPLLHSLQRLGRKVARVSIQNKQFDWSKPKMVIIRSAWDKYYYHKEYIDVSTPCGD